ncbi:hypothetical protein CW362_41785 [Streptomyces populi]|uniref:Large membrane protein n=1 Tax=Streptomyces populi TaxID=2058924 RepID=A0A2I0SB91_9ACTN|nr:hypothetical protein [Streptomyces populi]PKT67200.1 hypothetical protein CW362_41785 [Streptomyces populi]
MSTERPDNDATDPAGGRAGGHAEDAVAAEKTATSDGGSGEDRNDGAAAEGSVAGPAEGGAEDAVAEAAEDDAASPAEETAVSGVGVGSGEDRDGGAEDVPPGSAEGAAEADAGSGGAAVESRAQDPGDASPSTASAASARNPGGDDAEQSVAASAGAGRPEEGVAAGPVTDAVVVPVEGGGAGEGHRRRTPVVVASVVAAVLLVGGGGAYMASTASGGVRSAASGAEDTAPPRLVLDGYAASTGGTGGTGGIAPGEPDPYGTAYRAKGALPTGPGSAHVRWAEGRVTRAEVARLAKALGLAGTPRLAGDAWTVGAVKDGTEPNLRVTADAPGTWTFASALPGGDNCVKVTTCSPGDSGSPTGSAQDPVSEATARKAAAPVLKALGQDGAKLDAGQLMGQVRVVNADPVVGGLPTYGWTTGLRIGASGHVVGGSGQLKTPVEGDAYPVVSARKTLDLMNGSAPATDGRRMGIGGCASPVPLKDRDETPCEHPSPAEPQATTVEKATFGLAAQRANGRQALVPSWLFEVRPPGAQDTYTVTHTAVDPAFLASPQSPAPPSAEPAVPVPSGQPSSPTATHDVAVQGYTADGRDLKVDFTGGVCADYTVSAHETSDKVTVTVTEKPWKNKACIMIAKIYERTVRLDAPLDGREVVGSDGKAIHHGRFGVPETSAATPAEPR